LNALMRFTFPEPVILKRFLAPLWDFIFGIAVPSYLDPDVNRRAKYELSVDRAQGATSAPGSWS
jgi:hypothetical protein